MGSTGISKYLNTSLHHCPQPEMGRKSFLVISLKSTDMTIKRTQLITQVIKTIFVLSLQLQYEWQTESRRSCPHCGTDPVRCHHTGRISSVSRLGHGHQTVRPKLTDFAKEGQNSVSWWTKCPPKKL